MFRHSESNRQEHKEPRTRVKHASKHLARNAERGTRRLPRRARHCMQVLAGTVCFATWQCWRFIIPPPPPHLGSELLSNNFLVEIFAVGVSEGVLLRLDRGGQKKNEKQKKTQKRNFIPKSKKSTGTRGERTPVCRKNTVSAERALCLQKGLCVCRNDTVPAGRTLSAEKNNEYIRQTGHQTNDSPEIEKVLRTTRHRHR